MNQQFQQDKTNLRVFDFANIDQQSQIQKEDSQEKSFPKKENKAFLQLQQKIIKLQRDQHSRAVKENIKDQQQSRNLRDNFQQNTSQFYTDKENKENIEQISHTFSIGVNDSGKNQSLLWSKNNIQNKSPFQQRQKRVVTVGQIYENRDSVWGTINNQFQSQVQNENVNLKSDLCFQDNQIQTQFEDQGLNLPSRQSNLHSIFSIHNIPDCEVTNFDQSYANSFFVRCGSKSNVGKNYYSNNYLDAEKIRISNDYTKFKTQQENQTMARSKEKSNKFKNESISFIALQNFQQKQKFRSQSLQQKRIKNNQNFQQQSFVKFEISPRDQNLFKNNKIDLTGLDFLSKKKIQNAKNNSVMEPKFSSVSTQNQKSSKNSLANYNKKIIRARVMTPQISRRPYLINNPNNPNLQFQQFQVSSNISTFIPNQENQQENQYENQDNVSNNGQNSGIKIPKRSLFELNCNNNSNTISNLRRQLKVKKSAKKLGLQKMNKLKEQLISNFSQNNNQHGINQNNNPKLIHKFSFTEIDNKTFIFNKTENEKRFSMQNKQPYCSSPSNQNKIDNYDKQQTNLEEDSPQFNKIKQYFNTKYESNFKAGFNSKNQSNQKQKNQLKLIECQQDIIPWDHGSIELVV